mgnify:CR=1 FL=1
MLRRAFLDARHKLVAEHLIERFGFKPAHGKIGEHSIDDTEMHSSQMKMPFGPEIMAFTCSGTFPQKAQ